MDKLRKAVCAMLALVLPVSILDGQTAPAMLYSQGGVRLNGIPPPGAISIFPGDRVQTDKGIARLAANGSAVTIQTDTVLSFDGNEVVLDHGSVSVDTAQAFAVRVGCLYVIPVRLEGTQYDVTSANGKVTVVSRKSDVNVNHTNVERKNENRDNASAQALVRESEQKTWNDKCAAGVPSGQGATAGLKGPLLDSAWVKGAGGVVVAGLACWVICRHDDPISPKAP